MYSKVKGMEAYIPRFLAGSRSPMHSRSLLELVSGFRLTALTASSGIWTHSSTIGLTRVLVHFIH